MESAHISIDRNVPNSPFAVEIGQLALNWNSMHAIIFLLFQGLTGMPRSMAAAIYFAVKSDAAKRAMTRAAAVSILAISNVAELSEKDSVEKGEMLARIKTALIKIDALRDARNGAVHGAILLDRRGYMMVDPFFTDMDKNQFTLFGRLQAGEDMLGDVVEQVVTIFNDCAKLLSWPPELVSGRS